MARNRIMWSGAIVAALIALTALAGCGGGGSSTVPTAGAPASAGTATKVDTPVPAAEETADGRLLNKVLSRQEAAVDAYSAVIPELAPRLAGVASYFRTQEQEHVDAVLKAMRGLKIPSEPTPEPIDPGEPRSDLERLRFLYEVDSATIDEELGAIADLEADSPRPLLASIVANQGEHLTILRQELGASPTASVPSPFEDGTVPPPE